MKNILELAVFNIESALAAAKGGADRIELCENYANGGTTPSYGILKTVRNKVSVPVFVMLCPRAGDFLYTDEEFEVIKKDILICKKLNYDGVVCGILKADGSIDVPRVSELVQLAYPMEFTFHRAFDRCKDPLKAMEDIIDCGCNRILTSGQVPNALGGKRTIKQLIQKANNRITIVAGGGIRSNNIAEIRQFTGATEFHSSAKKVVASKMQFINPKMKDDLNQTNVDVEEIKKMKKLLSKK